MAKRKNKGRNVADYETIKNTLFSEYYDLLRHVSVLRDERTRYRGEQWKTSREIIKSRLWHIGNIGGASKNIDSETMKQVLGFSFEDYTTREEVLQELEKLVTGISSSMSHQGFLDTRLDDDTDMSEDLEDFFLDKKPAIYDR